MSKMSCMTSNLGKSASKDRYKYDSVVSRDPPTDYIRTDYNMKTCSGLSEK